ncbi:hypothetical protein V2O64_19700 [Verrucomicrobiaceae bacterium 227]
MNIATHTAAIFGAFTLSATLVHGQALTFLEDIKNFKQVGPNDSEYLGGSFDVTLLDGSYTILPCLYNGSPLYAGPDIFCSAGTTALVDSGDADGDGLRDNRLYFSVGQITSAIQVEPFQPSLIELYSAPPSELPRPLGGFNWRDNSVVLFYDLVTNAANLQGYEITRYYSSRPYLDTELKRHRKEIVPGTYTFKFPALGSDEENPVSFFVQVGHREMVEAYPGPGGSSVTSEGISVGNDFRVTNDEFWRGDKMEIDPRIVFKLEWEGFNQSTFLSADRVFFSVLDRATEEIVYPPYPEGNATFPQLIGSGTLGIPTFFELGPAFFSVGEERTVEINFVRNNPFGNAADISKRNFTWDIDFIDTYDGYILEEFPAGTTEGLTAPSQDYDGDGYTNLEEYALQTDALDPADVPNPTPVLVGNAQQCVLSLAKRPFVGQSLSYQVQYTTDLVTWTTITPSDPNWYIEFDNDALYQVRSAAPFGEQSCLTRVKITQNY